MNKIILITLILSGILFAGITTDIDISSYVDNNLYRSPQPINDLLTSVGIQLGYNPQDRNGRLYYSGNLILFKNTSIRNFNRQALGLNYYKSFGEQSSHYLYLGLDGTMRLNNDEYNYYNYNQLYGYMNLRFDFDWIFLRTGYNYRYRNYSNFSDLTNYRQYLFVQLNKSFVTRTTLILEADIGQKSFSGQETFYTTTEYSSGGRGQGRGSGSTSETVLTAQTLEIPSLSHMIVLARLAQSLHDKVGVFIQYRSQISLDESSQFNNSDDYYQDEELFDDPFSYESQSYKSQLTWIMFNSLRLQIGGSYTSKQYISEEAYVSAEDTLAQGGIRKDKHNNFYISLAKTIQINVNWLKSLQFRLNYNYIHNKSNSYWYDYRNGLIGGSLEWKF